MLHPSTQQLIRKLCELTDTGHITWKEGERQCSLFDSEGYVVEVQAEPPTLRLLRGDGRELERAEPADLAAAAWPDGEGTYATHLTDMAAKAHRIARGAEAAIARILSSLSAPSKSDEQTGPAPPPLAASAPPPPHAAPPPEPRPEPPRPEPEQSPPINAAADLAADDTRSPFGAVESFAKTPAPAPLVKPTSPPLMIRGFSARSVQTPESIGARDIGRSAPAAAKPEARPAPEPSIYKPWN